jgi:hypothetical protein
VSEYDPSRAQLEAALCYQIASGPDLATMLPEGFSPDEHVRGAIARELAWAGVAAASLGKSWTDYGGQPPIAALGVSAAVVLSLRATNTWRAVLVGLCGDAGLNRSMVRKYIERCGEYSSLALRSPAGWLMELTAEERRRGNREIVAVQTDG